jgi:hypothetical protein
MVDQRTKKRVAQHHIDMLAKEAKKMSVIRYRLQDVWPSLHSLPCWPDEFEVEIGDREYTDNPWLYTPPVEIQRLNTVAEKRGYKAMSRHDKDNRCCVLRYSLSGS